jgi:hypothetical protein
MGRKRSSLETTFKIQTTSVLAGAGEAGDEPGGADCAALPQGVSGLELDRLRLGVEGRQVVPQPGVCARPRPCRNVAFG